MAMVSEDDVICLARTLVRAHDEADLGASQVNLGKAISGAEFPEGGWLKKIQEALGAKKTKILKERFAF